MKVKYANKIFEVLYTKEAAGLTMYAVEDEPNHIDWLINVEVVDKDKKELKKIEQKPVDKVEPKNTPQLTEEDIRIIDNIIMEVNDELVSNKTTLSGTFYQEVLKRFNEVKEK